MLQEFWKGDEKKWRLALESSSKRVVALVKEDYAALDRSFRESLFRRELADPVDPTNGPHTSALLLHSSLQCRRWFFEDLPQTIAGMPVRERFIGSPELVKIVSNWPL